MKYIAKISSILLTVAVVVAIVYATDKNNETRLSKSSNTQQIQEKKPVWFCKYETRVC